MRILTSVLSILALTLAIGCGSDDDGGGGDVDAATAVDATVVDIDAALPTSADGQACTATQADPLGGCPATHACVNSKCLQTCTLVAGGPGMPMQPDGMACTAYDGPGFSVCALSLTTGDPPVVTAAACAIFCEDTMGTVPGCANGVCDGTCPNTFTCQAGAGAPAGTKFCQ